MAVMISQKGTLDQDILQTRLRYDEPLAHHTSLRIGGPADLFVVAESEGELLALVSLAREQGMDFLLLGSGSNVLVSDRGVRGLVILNRASEARFIPQKSGSILHAASGVLLSHLARQAVRQELGGLEWAAGIPGTLGGAIVQNAGAYGSCMADVVREVRIVDWEGLVRRLSPEELSLGYRTSRFRGEAVNPPEVILSAELMLRSRPQDELRSRMADYFARRRATQPSLPSVGSVFKNPPGDYAGRLIEAAGLKGMRQGDAMIAPDHANFIVNVGNARASDVKTLIDQARRAVAQRFGGELKLEIQLVGEW
ncbi:MAG: UDP-N-acetylmuramate dehydrogenase [Chloroflexota bacterium]|nr:UDP-N-acetylmuramate dehydrogenase [Chloroflexota bacterium]